MPDVKEIKKFEFKLPTKRELFEDIEEGVTPLGERIGGLSIFRNKFKRGSGAEVFGSDENGIWLGAAEFDSAPFRVAMNGDVTATSITLTGYIEDGGAAADVNTNLTKIEGGKIVTNSITATQIATNAITADKILAGAVTATKINVSTLSAITANVGTLTAGTIQGVTIKSEASGQSTIIAGTLTSYRNSSDSTIASVYASSSSLLIDGSTSSNILLDAGSGAVVGFYINGTSIAYVDSARLAPGSDASYDLGHPSFRWRDGWFSRDLDVGDDLTVGDNLTVADDIAVTDGKIQISAGFMNLAQMSGATADARADHRNGSMYYRTDDNVIRVKLNGTWKTITTS